MASCDEFLTSEGECMGLPIKSPQLKEDLHLFTPVEILGEIFCGGVYIYSAEKLITWGTDCEV